MEDNTTYRTRDLNLASILLTEGMEMKGTDRDNPRQIYFLFKDEARCEEICQKFFARSLTVEPQDLFNNQRTLKTIVFSQT